MSKIKEWYSRESYVAGYTTLWEEHLAGYLILTTYGAAIGTITNGTGVATGSPVTLVVGSNLITVTTAGTFTVMLPASSTTPLVNYNAVVSGCGLMPTLLVSGTQTITTTETGTLTILFHNVVYLEEFYYILNSDILISTKTTNGTDSVPIVLTYKITDADNATVTNGSINLTSSTVTKVTVIQLDPSKATANDILKLQITTSATDTLVDTIIACVSNAQGFKV